MKNETLQYENGEISEKEYFSWLSSKLAKNRTEKGINRVAKFM